VSVASSHTDWIRGSRRDEEVLASRETRDGIVEVTRKGAHLRMRLDNHYLLGSTESRENEERQAHLPILLHPGAKRVAFLGGGTEITAGAAVLHPVEEIAVVELIPAVHELARDYFAEAARGLHTDRRVRSVIGDARNVLQRERRKYDVIVGDLYVPWHRGTGNLYSKEYFEIVRSSLEERGLFCQWLPLYQISRRGLLLIVASLRAVFPEVDLWHGDFYVDRPIVGLIARNERGPLSLGGLPVRIAQIREAGMQDRLLSTPEGIAMLWFARAECFDLPSECNSDDWPLIEYEAALDQARGISSFTGRQWVDFCREVKGASAPRAELSLGPLTSAQRKALRAGPVLLEFVHRELEGDASGALEAARRLREALPPEVYVPPKATELDTAEEIRAEIERLRGEMRDRLKSIEESGEGGGSKAR
jgi:spermidine synthase